MLSSGIIYYPFDIKVCLNVLEYETQRIINVLYHYNVTICCEDWFSGVGH